MTKEEADCEEKIMAIKLTKANLKRAVGSSEDDDSVSGQNARIRRFCVDFEQGPSPTKFRWWTKYVPEDCQIDFAGSEAGFESSPIWD